MISRWATIVTLFLDAHSKLPLRQCWQCNSDFAAVIDIAPIAAIVCCINNQTFVNSELIVLDSLFTITLLSPICYIVSKVSPNIQPQLLLWKKVYQLPAMSHTALYTVFIFSHHLANRLEGSTDFQLSFLQCFLSVPPVAWPIPYFQPTVTEVL